MCDVGVIAGMKKKKSKNKLRRNLNFFDYFSYAGTSDAFYSGDSYVGDSAAEFLSLKSVQFRTSLLLGGGVKQALSLVVTFSAFVFVVCVFA